MSLKLNTILPIPFLEQAPIQILITVLEVEVIPLQDPTPLVLKVHQEVRVLLVMAEDLLEVVEEDN